MPEREPAVENAREVLALLALLAIGERELVRGAVSSIEDVVARIRDSRRDRA